MEGFGELGEAEAEVGGETVELHFEGWEVSGRAKRVEERSDELERMNMHEHALSVSERVGFVLDSFLTFFELEVEVRDVREIDKERGTVT